MDDFSDIGEQAGIALRHALERHTPQGKPAYKSALKALEESAQVRSLLDGLLRGLGLRIVAWEDACGLVLGVDLGTGSEPPPFAHLLRDEGGRHSGPARRSAFAMAHIAIVASFYPTGVHLLEEGATVPRATAAQVVKRLEALAASSERDSLSTQEQTGLTAFLSLPQIDGDVPSDRQPLATRYGCVQHAFQVLESHNLVHRDTDRWTPESGGAYVAAKSFRYLVRSGANATFRLFQSARDTV